jgi:hypothetical protein
VVLVEARPAWISASGSNVVADTMQLQHTVICSHEEDARLRAGDISACPKRGPGVMQNGK